VIVTLLTDYGTGDEFAGVCRAVIRRIDPDVEILDVGHGVPRHDVRAGALVMRNVLPYLPIGVHVAIVDPEVGRERRAVAIRCEDGHLLVGPDNGVLSLAWELAGGVDDAVDISRSPHRLEPVSATFHGRDVFAPVAANLAIGAELAEAGERIEAEDLATITLPRANVSDGGVTAHALVIDGFGNIGLNMTHAELAGTGLVLGGRVRIEAQGAERRATFARTFADVAPGEAILYEDAYRTLALAVNRGDAAAELGIARDAEVRLSPE